MSGNPEVGGPDWQKKHLTTYLATDGEVGHYLDFRPAGGGPAVPTLILKTWGRKSGDAHLTPLIYGRHGDEVVIIGSRGGAPEHPAWYLNLQSRPEVEFQIADQKWRGTWRELGDGERDAVWSKMVEIYPPFTDYQAKTDRKIPILMLKPAQKIERL